MTSETNNNRNDNGVADNAAKLARSRFKSVRSKPTSFSGWRAGVREAAGIDCDEDKDAAVVTKGTNLWKVRRKRIKGIACYRRKYWLDLESLCIRSVFLGVVTV